MRNKARKSLVASRTKKVIKLSEALIKGADAAAAAEQVPALEALVSDAYKAIDTAVAKGVLHANTGARRKARVARWKRAVLISAGAYTPGPSEPGYAFAQRLQAARAAKAGATK